MMKAYRRHCFFKKEELTSLFVCFSALLFQKSMNGGTEMSSLSLSSLKEKRGMLQTADECLENEWKLFDVSGRLSDRNTTTTTDLSLRLEEITWKSRNRFSHMM